MANIITMFWDGIVGRVSKWAYGDDKEPEYDKSQRYYKGEQDKQLKVIKGTDDNLITNYARLVVDRGISMLVGHNVDFYPPSDEAKQWLDLVWEANHKDIILHNMAKTGGIFGTPIVKLQPEGIEYKGVVYPRIIVQNPRYWKVEAESEDIEHVVKYQMDFNIVVDNKDVARREIFSLENGVWWLREYIDYGGGFRLMLDGELGIDKGEQILEYDFPLVHHWQNLPQFDSVYGEPDLTSDILLLQDRINYMSSNLSKIIRLYAHPKTFTVGITNTKDIGIGPDDMPKLPEGADMRQLSPIGDLTAAANYLLSLRQSMFDITRTVDISSMADKLGALTNFGLHVLYQDALSKLGTKQALYGEALEEINHRLLVIGGKDDDPGEVEFGDALPANVTEMVTAQKQAMDMGIQSQPGAHQALKEPLGLGEYEEIQAEIEEKKTNEKTLGVNLLEEFMRSGTVK